MSADRLAVGVPRETFPYDHLYDLDKTQMLFGDVKKVVGEVVDELGRLPARQAAA